MDLCPSMLMGCASQLAPLNRTQDRDWSAEEERRRAVGRRLCRSPFCCLPRQAVTVMNPPLKPVREDFTVMGTKDRPEASTGDACRSSDNQVVWNHFWVEVHIHFAIFRGHPSCELLMR